ncbi:MAG: trigger factor [bacterium]
MEIKVFEPEQWLRELEILVEPERVKKKIEEITGTYVRQAEVPGFRKGKVPRPVLEKRYGPALEAVAMDKLIDEVYKETIEAKNLKPLTAAKVTDYNLSEDKQLTFKISFEIIPEFELKEYNGIRLKKQEPTGFEQEFERRLKLLQDRCATFKPLKRPAENGDFILCDYGIYEGDNIIGKMNNNVLIQVNDEMNLKEINQGLLGVKPGDSKEITITFSEDNPDKSVAGKTLNYKFTIRDIKEKILPELNDNFAQDLGFKDLDELRQQLNDEILSDRAHIIESDLMNQIYNYLIQEHNFEPPASLIAESYNSILKEHNLKESEETKEKLMLIAKNRAKFSIVISRIAQQENIKPSPEEIEAKIQEYATQLKTEPAKLEHLSNNSVFLYEIIKEKTMDWILKNAKVE